MKSIPYILATTIILGLGLAARAQNAGAKKDVALQKAATVAPVTATPVPAAPSAPIAAPAAAPAPVPPAPAVAAAPAPEKEALNVC